MRWWIFKYTFLNGIKIAQIIHANWYTSTRPQSICYTIYLLYGVLAGITAKSHCSSFWNHRLYNAQHMHRPVMHWRSTELVNWFELDNKCDGEYPKLIVQCVLLHATLISVMWAIWMHAKVVLLWDNHIFCACTISQFWSLRVYAISDTLKCAWPLAHTTRRLAVKYTILQIQ